MKVTAYQRYKYSGDIYKFYDTASDAFNSAGEFIQGISTIQPNEYYFAGKMSLALNLKDVFKLSVRAEQPLAIGTVIANLVDSTGSLVLDDMKFQVVGLQPVVNSFNTIEEYSMKLAKWIGVL
jgi:hypothetical protein